MFCTVCSRAGEARKISVHSNGSSGEHAHSNEGSPISSPRRGRSAGRPDCLFLSGAVYFVCLQLNCDGTRCSGSHCYVYTMHACMHTCMHPHYPHTHQKHDIHKSLLSASIANDSVVSIKKKNSQTLTPCTTHSHGYSTYKCTTSIYIY